MECAACDVNAYISSKGLDPAKMPAHVAIIMDGNGRWATSKGKNRLLGHTQGYHTLKQIVYESNRLGLTCLTVYAFSTENWRRSGDEVGGLMTLMLEAMRAEIEELIQTGIRVRVSGRLAELPEDLREELQAASHRTKHLPGLIFNLAINYGGRAEVVDAVRTICKAVENGELRAEDVNENLIHDHLYSPDLPDPDLLIRTAGELRLSNFLLWETAYSEIYVTPVCWPDFDPSNLVRAIADFQRRTRKFGTVVEEAIS